ncbi:MAG: trehalose-6-phosphate synthase [Thermoanaerobaculia bacterium]
MAASRARQARRRATWCWSRTITSLSCPAWSARRCGTRWSDSSGTSRGRTPAPSRSVPEPNTKGLLERVAAIELLLDEHPELRGRYVHVQIAAPTRMQIGRYRDLSVELAAAVARVNERFGSESYTPLVLRLESMSSAEVRRHYAMADSALVTPLHDGMNLVAKEYAASCSEARGALVLSRFTGAAAELDGALLVNPYDLREVAGAIVRAVQMPAAERAGRLRRMRRALERNTVDDWAVSQLADLARVREERRVRWRAEDDDRSIETRA